MSFTQAINSCFLKFITFSGRATRSEFWFFYLFTQLFFGILYFFEINLGAANSEAFIFLNALAAIALIPPQLSVAIRRLHDTGRSGFWMLAPVVPLLLVTGSALAPEGTLSFWEVPQDEDISLATTYILLLSWVAILLALFVFMVLPGDPKNNQFGPNPLNGQANSVPSFSNAANVKKIPPADKPLEDFGHSVAEGTIDENITPRKFMPSVATSQASITQNAPEGTQVAHGPKDSSATARRYRETALKVIDYRQEASVSWEKIKELPEVYHHRFLDALGKTPKCDVDELESKLFAEYKNILRPFENERANNVLEDVRTIGPEAEREFKEVYEMLSDTVCPEKLGKQIEAKFGPAAKTKAFEEQQEQKRLAQEKLRQEQEQKQREEQARTARIDEDLRAKETADVSKEAINESANKPQEDPVIPCGVSASEERVSTEIIEKSRKQRNRKHSLITIAIGSGGIIVYLASLVLDPASERQNDQLIEIQRKIAEVALQSAGYGPLVVDGYFDQRTVDAIRQWQVDNDFRNNGILTIEQYERLLER